ncbi:MAG: ABC transporter ATP-binding protein [Bacilli bacterium]|jgi:iron(III) transport system ATP-binding protein|nr:ABC transporter ATP-binding protein [Bacilli bacterium]HHU23935.1 ABC transporter ATP-binding protein [Acholeplasmataceae bacterium]
MSVSIKIEHAIKRFGKKTIIPDLSLEIKKGEFFTLLGPSGCGKTTLLRMIAGFNTIEGGDFYFDDLRINNIPAFKRNIGMVFQNYAVFPHMTVEGNVGYGLKQRKIKNPEYDELVDQVLQDVHIEELKDRYPAQMSGGQQQRVALARAIVIQPNVLLMDEPLSNLDAKLRVEMRLAIKRIQKQKGITAIYVTHDQEEALAMSDRIAIMNFGVIQQVGTPIEVYSHPSNYFVATFIGHSNTFNGWIKIEKGKKYLELDAGHKIEINDLIDSVENEQTIKMVVRPNEIEFSDEGIKGIIFEKIFLGAEIRYTVKLESGQLIEIHKEIKDKMYEAGDEIFFGFDPSLANVFDAKTEKSLMARNESK